jgi:hypothetical protein
MSTKISTEKNSKGAIIQTFEIVGKNEKPTEVVEKATETAEAVEAKKADVLQMIEKFKPEPLTAEERIERMPLFEELSKRFKLLKGKANDLKMFNAGNDKTNAKIIFKNAQGFEFEIRNSNVIEKLTQEAQKELNILLAEANTEILAFEM